MDQDFIVTMASIDRTVRTVICPLYLMEDLTKHVFFLVANPSRAYCRLIAKFEHRYWEREPYTYVETLS